MRHQQTNRRLRLAACVVTSIAAPTLMGCGLQPIVDAGIDREVEENETVLLSATNLSTADFDAFVWEQISGPIVELQNGDTRIASFTAPAVGEATELTFRLTAYSSIGTIGLPVFGDVLDVSTDLYFPAVDSVTVTVMPAGGAASSTGSGVDLRLKASHGLVHTPQ